MTQTAIQLRDQLAALPEPDRAALAHFLLGTLSPEFDDSVQDEWDRELERRAQLMHSGSVLPLPGPETMAQLREKHS
jgi:hypothetical protein